MTEGSLIPTGSNRKSDKLVSTNRYHRRYNRTIKIEPGILHCLYHPHSCSPFLLLAPRCSCGSSSRNVRFLSICLGRGNLVCRPPRPCRGCTLTLGIVTGVAWFVLLLGRGVFAGYGIPRARWELRLLRQCSLVCSRLGWNRVIVFLLLDSLDPFPPSRFLGGWGRAGLVLIGDRCVPRTPPGSCPRVRRGGRFLCRRGGGLALFRRGGCGSTTGHPAGRRVRRDIWCPTCSAHNFTASSVCSLGCIRLFLSLSRGRSRSSSGFGGRCGHAGALSIHKSSQDNVQNTQGQGTYSFISDLLGSSGSRQRNRFLGWLVNINKSSGSTGVIYLRRLLRSWPACFQWLLDADYGRYGLFGRFLRLRCDLSSPYRRGRLGSGHDPF